jgi:hypothetical protein
MIMKKQMFAGTEGVMPQPHFSLPALFPKAKFQDFKSNCAARISPRLAGQRTFKLNAAV